MVEIDLTDRSDGACDIDDFALEDLPAGATLQPDGGIALALDYPVVLRRPDGAGGVREERHEVLAFRRLNGAEMVQVLEAGQRAEATAFALSTGLRAGEISSLMARMDAADYLAAARVVSAMLGAGEGLPPEAETQPDGSVHLALRQMATLDGVQTGTLTLHRLRGQDLMAVARKRDRGMAVAAIAASLRVSEQKLREMLETLDAADVMGAQRVVGFLSQNGRPTGR